MATAVRCTSGATASALNPMALPDIETAPTGSALHEDRCGGAHQAEGHLLAVEGHAVLVGAAQLLEEPGRVGDRVAGMALKPASRTARSPRGR